MRAPAKPRMSGCSDLQELPRVGCRGGRGSQGEHGALFPHSQAFRTSLCLPVRFHIPSLMDPASLEDLWRGLGV